jgi:hypothetical protein
MPVDIGAILSRAFQTVLRNRVLWMLGFLVAILSGIGNNNFTIQDNERYRIFDMDVTITPQVAVVIIGIGVLVALGFFFLRAILDAGLIAAGDRSARTEPPTFGEAWRAGVAGMWPVIALNLIFAAFVVLLVLAAALFIGMTVAGAILAGVFSGQAPQIVSVLSTVGLGVFAVLLLVVIGVPLGIVLGVVTQVAQRAAVLEHQRIGAAWQTGWRVMRSNLGTVCGLLLVQFVVSVLVGGITAAIPIPLVGAPALLVIGGHVATSAGGVALIVLLIGGAWMLGGVLMALPTAWNSLLWTLFYRAVTFRLPQATERQARYGGQLPPTVPGGYSR